MSDLRSKRTIYTREAHLECGSIIELPPRLGQPHGRMARVMRKVTCEDAWSVQRVDVAKYRLIDGSEMELTGKYLQSAKLAYSSHVWQERCIAARLEESRIPAKHGSFVPPRKVLDEEFQHA